MCSRETPLRSAIGLLCCWVALAEVTLAASNPAHFERGKDVTVVSTRVGPQGATLNTGNTGTPVDGITVEIPAGALTQELNVTLSYNTGTLSLPSGESSGVFLGLSAEQLNEFQQPVTIRIRYDAKRHQNVVLVGYAIDAEGRLRAVNQESQDNKAGLASFSTYVPLLFTWVYASL
jgi:hypothetical protein